LRTRPKLYQSEIEFDNMHATLGHSLGDKTRERINVMTAEVNGCNYCLSAHTYLGAKLQGLTQVAWRVSL